MRVPSSGQAVLPMGSASPNANNTNNAWQLNFNTGNDNTNNRNNNNRVRLVRSSPRSGVLPSQASQRAPTVRREFSSFTALAFARPK